MWKLPEKLYTLFINQISLFFQSLPPFLFLFHRFLCNDTKNVFNDHRWCSFKPSSCMNNYSKKTQAIFKNDCYAMVKKESLICICDLIMYDFYYRNWYHQNLFTSCIRRLLSYSVYLQMIITNVSKCQKIKNMRSINYLNMF